MGVTDVIRGDDHTSNTPRQVMVYNALGFSVPRFAHVPMILGTDGKKLSKRDGAADVMEYKELGYQPEALLNFLVRLGWSHGDKELFSMAEMLELFDPKNINSSASQYNLEKLNWISGEHIKNTPFEKLKKQLAEYGCDLSKAKNEELALRSVCERAKTLVELASGINSMLNDPHSYDEKAVEKNINESAKVVLSEFLQLLQSCNHSSPEGFKVLIDEFLASKSLKMPQLGLPLRIALTGSTQSPSLNELLSIVGAKTAQKRIESFLSSVG
jgi:glutamyl-tRNA synthetase